MGTSFQYSAFISYTHVPADAAWAKWLQSTIERYRVPAPIRKLKGAGSRLRRVFRDTDELTAAPSLSEALRGALAASEKLIVVCSPASHASVWVQQEVAEFLRVRGREHVLLVLTAGEPATAFPPAILASGDEPLAIDVRVAAGERVRARRHHARQVILATLLEIGLEDLVRREHQRQRRVLLAITGTVVGIAAAMTVLAMVAILQRREAVAQREIAEQNERLATTRLSESLLEQGHANNLARRWAEGFGALDEARTVLARLGKPALRVDLLMLEAEHTLIPFTYRTGDFVDLAASQRGDRLALATGNHIEVVNLLRDERVSAFDAVKSVSKIAISPDGARVAAASEGTIQIFEAQTGREQRVASLPTATARWLAFAPDGRTLLVAASDGGVHSWNLDSDRIVKLLDRDVPTVAFACSQNGEILAVHGADARTEICRLSQERCDLRTVVPTGKVDSLALTEDGKFLLTGDTKHLRLWDWQRGAPIRESSMDAHQMWIAGDALLTAGLDGSVTASGLSDGETLGNFNSPTLGEQQIALSRARMALFTVSDSSLLYWQMTLDSVPGSGVRFFPPKDRLLAGIAVAPDGKLVAAGDSAGLVHVLDTLTLSELAAFQVHQGEATDLAFTRDGDAVVSLGADGVVVWDLVKGEARVRRALGPGKPTAFAFHLPTGVVAAASEPGTVQLIDPSTGRLAGSPIELGERIVSLAFDAGGARLAMGTAKAVHLWSRDRGIRKLGDVENLHHVRFAASGELLVVGQNAELWQLTSGEKRRLPGGGDVFDAGFLGSDLLYEVGFREVKVVSVDGGRLVATLPIGDEIWGVSASTPSGDVLVSGGISSLIVFVPSAAAERTQLRRQLSALPRSGQVAATGEQLAVLARWYVANGWPGLASRYLDEPDFPRDALPMLSTARAWKAAGDLPRAEASLTLAAERREVSAAYAALAKRSLQPAARN